MTRSEELDHMTEEDKQADILKNLREHECIRLDRKQQLAFWGAAIDALKSRGEVVAELVEVEEQYSYLKVTLP